MDVTATSTVEVTINANPTVAASTSDPDVCGNEAIVLNAAGTPGSAGITGYNWNGPAGFASTSQNPTILPASGNYPSAGTHTYNVTVTDANGCTATSSIDVIVNANPTVTADVNDQQVCNDQPIELLSTAIQGSAVISSYAWSGPNGYTASVQNPVINPSDAAFPSAGNHTYGVTVTDANGCTATATVAVIIFDTPSVAASASNSVCDDQNIAFTAFGVPGSATITGYAWSGPFGYTAAVQNPTLVTTAPEFPPAGTHTYYVTVTDGNGCTALDSASVIVFDNPAVVSDVSSPVCVNQDMIFVATPTAGSATISGYAWSGPFGFSSNQQNLTLATTDPAYPNPGTYVYSVTVTGRQWLYRNINVCCDRNR